MPPTVRGLAPSDRAPLEAVLRSDATFRSEEIDVALELIDEALTDADSDYSIRVAEDGGAVVGYICYGAIPMTTSMYDLYWVVTHAAARGRGVAKLLIGTMEDDLRAAGATGVRIETSQLDGYGAARHVYQRLGYQQVGHIPDFYVAGDDLLTYYKRL